MARARKSAKSKTNVSINFKGVESRRTPPEGDYVAKILEAENGTSGAGNDQITFVAEISRGEYKGTKLWMHCPLAENSLWKLHAWLTALGEEVPEDEVDIDLADLVDKELVVVLSHETYQGKKKAKITDFQSLEDYDGDADLDDDGEGKGAKSKKKSSKKDDEAPAKGGKGKKPKKPNYDDMDEDDLRELYIERKLGTKKEAGKLDEDELKEALEEADEAGDEPEEEAPAKAKKGAKEKAPAKGKKKAKKYEADDIDDMDEDELQDVIDESGIDVDLDDHKSLKKKVAAVKEALEEADLLED